MVYPTGSLERFVQGLLEDSIPERSETNGRLSLIEPEVILGTMTPSTDANDLHRDMSSEFDFAVNHECNDSDLNSSGVSNDDELSAGQIFDARTDGELLEIEDCDEDCSSNRLHGSSIEEICSFQIMDLLDRLGAPRNGYDRLIALLRKQKKMGFKLTKAIGRETLMNMLKKRFPSSGVLSQTLDHTKIFFFPFTHMLQDLLDSMKETTFI